MHSDCAIADLGATLLGSPVILIDLSRSVAMDVWLSTSSEAFTAARSRALGLETWNPAAPGRGLNSVTVNLAILPSTKQGVLTVGHFKSTRLVISPPA